jgi:hypothetical protein
MKRLSIFSCVLLLSLCIVNGVEKQGLTVVDYFLLLPRDYFEGSPAGWLSFLRQPKCGVVDIANGYISCTGDGAQPEFEVALFRYRDSARAGLLAVCQGELEGPDSVYLDFFELGSDGKMKKLRRSIFPVADAGNDKGDWRFQLPREGKTVLVRHQRGGKTLRKLTWNREKFQDEK